MRLDVNKEYVFVDFIRFISMMGIVWAHTYFVPHQFSSIEFIDKVSNTGLYLLFMQFFKFAVICFFLISGYLLGEKIRSTPPYQYFKRRVKSTIKPYLIVFLISLTLAYIKSHWFQPYQAPSNLMSLIQANLFETPFWYLPNYLISLAAILIFSKYLNRKWFGWLLLFVTITYSILTVYNFEYQAPHTFALFGFVFYLWLGIYIRQNNTIEMIYKIKGSILLLCAFGFFILSGLESYLLYINNYTVLFSVLRFSNQLYSVSMFCVMVKFCRKPIAFKFFNPRKETYGIYLYFWIIAAYGLPVINLILKTYVPLDLYIFKVEGFILIFLIYFSFIYFTTTLLVKLLLKCKLGYLNNHNL